jgi:hypothetical protein
MARHFHSMLLALAFICIATYGQQLTEGYFATICSAQNSTENNSTDAANQQVQWCDGTAGMCFAINIPSNEATDYYVSMTAPQNIG